MRVKMCVCVRVYVVENKETSVIKRERERKEQKHEHEFTFWPRRICEVRPLAWDEISVDAFCSGRQLLDAVRGDRSMRNP